jgi:hypothetical protein
LARNQLSRRSPLQAQPARLQRWGQPQEQAVQALLLAWQPEQAKLTAQLAQPLGPVFLVLSALQGQARLLQALEQQPELRRC